MRNVYMMSCLLATVLPAVAQNAPAPDPCAAGARASFDVVSIKPSQTPSDSSSIHEIPDGVVMIGSLRRMMLFGFNLHDFQLMGSPDWVSTATWVVNAKNETPDPDFSKLSRAEQQALWDKRMQQVQSMLMDRFQLKCHMATKELPIYELVQAKGGAKLKPTTAQANEQNSDTRSGPGLQMHQTATGVTADLIVSVLTNEVDRMVVDKTGLTGSYDLTLDWVRDAPADSTDASAGPTIFTALEEQLGLKLVAAKGPVPVLVIDAVEKPSAN